MLVDSKQYITSSLIFLVAFGFYLWHICPTIYWEDCGEFVVASANLGVVHTPGHPLYPLLGRLFSLLPFGSIAFRINLMSIFFSALTVVVIYHLLPDKTRFFGAVLATVTLPYWEVALAAEVYTLQNFLFFTSLFFLIRYLQTSQLKTLYLFAFFYGLTLANNPSPIFFAPLFLLFIFFHWWRYGFSVSTLLMTLFIFLLPLTLYLYPFIRSQVDPIPDWGNPETWRNLVWLLSGGEFGKKVTEGSDIQEVGFGGSLMEYIIQLPMVMGWVILGFAGIGAAFLVCRNGLTFLLLLSIAIINILYSHLFWGISFALPGYLAISYLIWIVLAGVGIDVMIRYFQGLIKVRGILIVLYGMMFALCLPNTFQLANETPGQKRASYMYGRGILDATTPNSIFITENTLDLFATMYVQQIEHRQPTLIVVYGQYLYFRWYREQLKQLYPNLVVPDDGNIYSFARENLWQYPIFYSPYADFAFPAQQLIPQGLIYQWLGKNRTISQNDLSLGQYTYHLVDDNSPATRLHYALFHGYRGDYFVQRNELERAKANYQTAIEIDPDNPNLYFNLGFVYQKEHHFEQALALYELALKLKPNFVQAVYNSGTIYLEQQKLKKAENAFHQAININPDYVKAYHQLGNLYLQQHLFDNARQMYEKAIVSDSTYVDSYKALGLIHFHVFQNSTKAKFYLETYISLKSSPIEFEVTTALSQMNREN